MSRSSWLLLLLIPSPLRTTFNRKRALRSHAPCKTWQHRRLIYTYLVVRLHRSRRMFQCQTMYHLETPCKPVPQTICPWQLHKEWRERTDHLERTTHMSTLPTRNNTRRNMIKLPSYTILKSKLIRYKKIKQRIGRRLIQQNITFMTEAVII